jgi:hypothetical protein
MSEGELRRSFARMRDADRQRAPSFAQISESARTRTRRRATLRVRPLVIGAAAVVLIAAVWLKGHERSLSPSVTVPAIGTWRAPTDVLLRTPGIEMLGAMPALGASVLDKMIPTPSNRGT